MQKSLLAQAAEYAEKSANLNESDLLDRAADIVAGVIRHFTPPPSLELGPGCEPVRVIEFGLGPSRDFMVQVLSDRLRDFPTMTLVEAILAEAEARLSEEQVLVLQASVARPTRFFTRCWLFLLVPSTENGLLGYLCYAAPYRIDLEEKQ